MTFSLFLLALLLLLLPPSPAVRIVNYPLREVDGYRSYSDVTILHLVMPDHVRTATWNLTSREVKRSFSFSSCEPRAMTAYFQHGSLPVVSPDSSRFPDSYFVRDTPPDRLALRSDEHSYYYNVTNPVAGDWFAIVFSDYTDPDEDEIVQSGLTLVCAVIMEASVDVSHVDAAREIAPLRPLETTLDRSSQRFKFFVAGDTRSVCIGLRALNGSANNDVVATIESSSRSHASVAMDTFRGSDEDCAVDFRASVNGWYYLTVVLDTPDKVYSVCDVSIEIRTHDTNDCNVTSPLRGFQNCWETLPLIRESQSGFFAYRFDRLPLDNGTIIPYTLISTDKPKLLTFNVNGVQDIGGTLSLEIKINLKSLEDVLKTLDVKVVACIGHEQLLLPRAPNLCLSKSGESHPSQLQANTSSEATKTHINILHIPYPELGTWHLTLSPFCFVKNTAASVETPCVGLDRVNVSFILESASCDPNGCGEFGKCYSYMNGGIMFASCRCWHGYRGWGCTDDSKVTPDWELLVAALLLTISNLFFVPAIVIAIRRRYYTEALVYAFTMFFSTFYHACDAGEDIYSYCIMPLGVLSFCDFYTAVLSLWVTMIAMADVGPVWTSLAHMGGAVSIALGSEYNRTSLWMFLAPLAIGLAVLMVTWGVRMRKSRTCYPNKKYWKYYLPPGLLLISIGLICFAFLQTTRNYKYVHSSWHAIIAVSILIVLPMRDDIKRAREVSLDNNACVEQQP